jgi:preprotein translocase subunit SecE
VPSGALFSMGAISYIKETKTEMKHVTWPSRVDVLMFTATIIVVSIVTALYLGLFDFLFSRALEAVLGGGGTTPEVTVPAPTEGGETPLLPSTETPAFDPEAILNGEGEADLSL